MTKCKYICTFLENIWEPNGMHNVIKQNIGFDGQWQRKLHIYENQASLCVYSSTPFCDEAELFRENKLC